MKNFISIKDCSTEVIEELINRSEYWKMMNKKGTYSKILENKVIGMIFEKPSTRTRVAFEMASERLGGRAMYMNSGDLQLSRNEPIKDTARVLSSYINGIVIRTHKHEVLEEFVEYSDVPIINGLSEKEHPCQTIADLLTIREELGQLYGEKIVFVGRYNNVSHSLMMGSLKMGMEFCLLVPTWDIPGEAIIEEAQEVAEESGGKLLITEDLKEAMEDSRIIYTDVWQSMGDDGELDRANLMSYQLNYNLLKYAEKTVKVMHCLPAKRGEEITEEVFEEHAKTIFQQAENRLYSHMAILEKIMN